MLHLSYETESENMSNTVVIKKEQTLKELKGIYYSIKPEIMARLDEFKDTWIKGGEKDIFAELVFCILTPQSKAKLCDSAVGCLIKKDLIFQGPASEIAKELKEYTRFHNNKARYIVDAQKIFTKNKRMSIKGHITSLSDPNEVREWFKSNIKGFGYKEASHFLRNIGMGEELAILDRHILKNLKLLGVIGDVPNSISKTKYYMIEDIMMKFSKKIKIPMAHLDLLLWYMETGEIFK